MGAERFVHNVSPDHAKTEKDHFYPTPPEATKSLLVLERFGPLIWEPACGDGAISKVLMDAGHTVASSDLVDRGFGATGVDFLMERRCRSVELVTNPPFKLAEQFVRHAMDLGVTHIAMLLRLAWLEGTSRKDLVEKLARVHVSSRRLTMKRGGTDEGAGGGGMVAFAWFVWDRASRPSDPSLRFFDWMDFAPEHAREKAKAAPEPMTLFAE